MKLTKEELEKFIADTVAKAFSSVDMKKIEKMIDEQLKELKKPLGNKLLAGAVQDEPGKNS